MFLFVSPNVISLCQNLAKYLFQHGFPQAVIDIQICQDGLAQDVLGIQKSWLEGCLFLDEYSRI